MISRSWIRWLRRGILNRWIPPTNSTLQIPLTDGCFIETFAFVQEMRNVLGIHLEQIIFAQVLDACELNRKKQFY